MFTKQSRQQRHCNQTRTARWLIIPALIILGVVEHNLRESRVKADFTRLEQRGTDEEAQAVEDLVEGCAARRFNHWLPAYLAERQRGNCRSLAQAPLFGASIQSVSLSNADLREADLRYANLTLTYFQFTDFRGANLSNAVLRFNDLREANLSNANLSNASLSETNFSGANLSDANLSNTNLYYANLSDANLSNVNLSNANLNKINLRNADLSDANLSNTNLSNADLREANLSNADLSEANLSEATALNTDLRTTRGLTQQQLVGNAPLLICNSPLPQGIEIDKDRDCNRFATALYERYRWEFGSIEGAEAFVNQERQRRWE